MLPLGIDGLLEIPSPARNSNVLTTRWEIYSDMVDMPCIYIVQIDNVSNTNKTIGVGGRGRANKKPPVQKGQAPTVKELHRSTHTRSKGYCNHKSLW